MPRVFAVGDPIIDENVFVRATHIAPDAPISVCVKERASVAPGGLWNAAGNLRTAGADTYVFGVIGDDLDSFTIENFSFPGRGMSLVVPERRTQRKTRFLGQYGQQILRVDIPKDGPIADIQAIKLIASMKKLAPPDAVLVSDYGCGVVTKCLMESLRATFHEVPIVVDPYPTADPRIYAGADCLKLNSHEYRVLSEKLFSDEALTDLVRWVIVTDGPSEVTIKRKDATDVKVEVPPREMVDACGAGDAFSGYLTWALASRCDLEEAVEIGVHAGACAVTRRGVYLVEPKEVFQSMVQLDAVPTILTKVL